MLYDDHDRIRVRNAVAAVTALAWVLLIAAPHATDTHPHESGSNGVLPASGAALNWLLMLAAMMAPVLIQPIQFIRGQGLARRRTRATWLFVAGYSSIWMGAGALMLSIETTVDSAGLGPFISAMAAVAVASVWQCSPAKQVCLNRCHRRPTLAAFGLRADADTIGFGATHGGWCVASCWASMLVPLILPGGHVAAMMAASVLIFCERLDKPTPPAWRWRGPGTAWRVVSSRLRLQPKAGG